MLLTFEKEKPSHPLHPHMILDLDLMVSMSTLKDKTTAVIPTSTAPIDCLLWTIFSMLLHTRPDESLEHICVCVNGPDPRTGSTALQDKKQAFLEDLRRLKWEVPGCSVSRDMPLTVIRAWSRIGHPEAIEMATPWIHTDSYLITHDDIIITKPNWLEEANKFYQNPNAAVANWMPLYCALCDTADYQNKKLLRLPHMLCTFLLCKKPLIDKTKASWCGYHIPIEDHTIEQLTGDASRFINIHKDETNHSSPPNPELIYNFLSMEMGAWLINNIRENGFEYMQMDPDLIVHFGAMSWDSEEGKKQRLGDRVKWTDPLESEILQHPTFGPLYSKYATK